MPKKSTISQAKYDSIHCKHYHLKLVDNTDNDIIEKLSSVPSMQGYIKQLIRDDISRTYSVPVSDTAMALLKEEAVKISKSVPDLVNLIIDDWFVRNR